MFSFCDIEIFDGGSEFVANIFRKDTSGSHPEFFEGIDPLYG